MVIPPPSQHSDADRCSSESRALDCNLTAICDHIQLEGFNSGSFSDIVIHSMGSTFYLHRLILSRSSYFRNMLHGPWKEASAQVLTLNVDDNNVNGEAVAMALAYLYGHHPRLNDSNAFRVLAAASFLDLQDLCAICTDFVISELWSSNFLVYQVFAESQDYGIHGKRVRNACWGYLCQSGALELKQALPRLSSRTLYALLNSDALWIPSEEKRFDLALFTLLAKGALCKTEQHEQENLGPGKEPDSHSDFKNSTSGQLESQSEDINLKDKSDGHGTVHSILKELADHVVDFDTEVSSVKQLEQCSSLCNSKLGIDVTRSPCSYVAVSLGVGASGPDGGATAMEGPSEEVQCFRLNKNFWFNGDQPNETFTNPLTSSFMPSEWGRFDLPPFTCDGRVVGRRQCSSHARENCGMREDESEAFFNIFEGGSLLYSNMSFEALINVKKQLEDLGFPCKAVNDGLWLQMLLRQRVQEIGVDACKNCWLTNTACPCRQPVGFQHGCTNSGCHFQRHDQNIPHSNMGNIYVTDSNHGEGRPVRVHVRDVDGLAGIGRGATFVTADAWPPTRFVFSRVPFGANSRINQQSVGNDDTEASMVHNGDLSGDGLTALVGLSQGGRNTQKLFGEQSENRNGTEVQKKLAGASVVGPNTSGIPIQILDSSQENGVGIEWDTTSSSISLDMKTPLVHFPPFRFGVEFEDVHRLTDGQVKHSPEAYYAGSLWKVSVQAFNDEDPQGRRTLGLFLHRRRAEITDPVRKVHMFVDTREKVIARYKLLCPSKRDVMVLGNFSETGTLLPKAPKGWGWRSALLFNELEDLLQNGALRVAAVVQLV